MTKARDKVKRLAKKPARRKVGGAVARFKWNPRVACRTLDGTAFILLNSRMLRLNEVGTYIWERFENGTTVAKVVDGIVSEFETTPKRAETDARTFVRELVAKEVLVPASQSGRSL